MGMRHHYSVVMRDRKEMEASVDKSSAEDKAAREDMGRVTAVRRVKALQAHNLGLESSCSMKDAELQRQAKEIEELRSFKSSAEGKIKELEGEVEALTEEVAQVKVTTRSFTLEQVFKGSLTLELVKEELDALATLWDGV